MLFVLLSLLLSPASEQPRVAAMDKLSHWVGVWKGSGWAIDEKGQRFEFTLTETVQRKVAGTVMLLEGKGVRKSVQPPGDNVTHDGLTIISYDEKTKRYLWQGHDTGRDAMTTELQFVDAGMQWSIPMPGRPAMIRFTIRIEKDRWHEVGEFSSDAKAWSKFMEVTLTRQ